MSTTPRIEYAIFDMDGLLIDSERIHTVVVNNILRRFGKEMTWDIKAGCMGKHTAERESATHLLSFFPDLPEEFTLEEYIKELRVGQNELWPTVRPLPGAVKLVQHLHRHKIPIAIATGSPRFKYDLKTSHLMDELFSHFEGKVVCADDGHVKRGKPHPDIFLATAKSQFGRDVGEGEEGESHITDTQRAERAKGLIFEDAIAGIRAGKRAGMKVVWVPDPNLVALGERGVETVTPVDQPDVTLRSLEDFVPEQWGLPPYDS